MGGYLVNLDSEDSLKLYIKNGIFSTKGIKPAKRTNYYWGSAKEGTIADYSTMKPGENIYFFINRKIYGIGKLTNINGHCKFLNYPNANKPKIYEYDNIKEKLLWNEDDYSTNQRWICSFKPEPYFFKEPVDMDEALNSDPDAFKMIRAFSKVSMIKFDDKENTAIKNIIIRKNKESLINNSTDKEIYKSNWKNKHNEINKMIEKNNNKYDFNVKNILSACNDGTKLKHEAALEAGLLHQLTSENTATTDVFGNWDYLSRQVVASPFKPIDWMDKIDVFGYSNIPGFTDVKYKFLITELKRGTANIENLTQLMKYVDWIREEYCSGDYSMINAFLVAYSIPESIKKEVKNICKRNYTLGERPIKTGTWNNVKLVTYTFDEEEQELIFKEI